jgi:adenylate kinase family enzyme
MRPGSTMRVVIFGNSGSGKTTLARAIAREHGVPHLDLDSLAWAEAAVRRPPEESAAIISDFLSAHDRWVVEGCYGDLLEQVLPSATEVRFLNPGVEACVRNCESRPWEPEKYPSREDQDRRLPFLLEWVRQYATRDDEYSLARHQALFDAFAGVKLEVTGAVPDPGAR